VPQVRARFLGANLGSPRLDPPALSHSTVTYVLARSPAPERKLSSE